MNPLCSAPRRLPAPAYVEVLHGKIEKPLPSSEKVSNGLQSAACLGREHRLGRRQQVAERLAVGASHTSAHLMQVGQSEAVGVVDDDGVGIGDVDAVLHDGRGEQHVVIIIHKAHEDLLQLLGRHLTVADGHTGVGHILMDQLRDLGQVAICGR